MFRVWNCLESQHDWRLVLLAGFVCFLTSLAAVNMYQHSQDMNRKAGLAWLITAGCVTGAGIWSTHFIAMLAYTPGFSFEYDLTLTMMSLVAATVMTTAGFAIAAHGARGRGTVAGGAIVGIGIASMHYMGMASLNFTILWARDLVAVSVLLSVVFGVAALFVAQRRHTPAVLCSAAGLLTLAIVSHHFVAMGAISFLPPMRAGLESGGLSAMALCIAVASVTTVVVVACLLATVLDRRSIRQINERSMQLDAALNNMSQGLCMFDKDHRLVICNARYCEMYGIPEDAVGPGTLIADLHALRTSAGTMFNDPDFETTMAAAIENRIASSLMVQLQDGRTIYLTYQPMETGGWIATHQDHTEEMATRARIAHMAHHDALTDLPNRAAFDEKLDDAIKLAVKSQTGFAAICVDLDHFKSVNDIYGHAAGDEFLRETSRRLIAACGGAFVARVGGDEFVVIAAEGPQPAVAEAITSRIAAEFEKDFLIKDAQLRGSCTMGVSIFPQDGATGEVLIANADAALYRAKADMRGSIRFFETELDNNLRERRILYNDLIAAVEREEFEPYFQPQVTTQGEIIGFEVLVRWRHPVRGLISPAEFIPLAEETGLISAIDEGIMRAACREAATWPKPLSIAVNLSPVDFRRGNVAARILAVLLETGLEPNRLHIEITEGVLMENFARAVAELRKIRNMGVHLAMDDFGSGYSSLSYLQAFPFDKIKIDRSFVAEIGKNPQSAVIVSAIIGLGRSLDLTVIAEGVETKAQLDFLNQSGCQEIQGYWFGRPQPIAYYRNRLDGAAPNLQPQEMETQETAALALAVSA